MWQVPVDAARRLSCANRLAWQWVALPASKAVVAHVPPVAKFRRTVREIRMVISFGRIPFTCRE